MKNQDEVLLKLAKLNMICGFGALVFLVLGIISFITYIFGFNGVWLVIVAFGLAILSQGFAMLSKSSIRLIENG